MSLWPTGFENPWLWPLMAVAFLPLVLHILDRRRARVVDWPAVRFLMLGSRSRLRRWRLREALLILTRSVLGILVVLALLRPTVRETVAGAQPAPRGRGVVLILDTSYSMTYRDSEGAASSWETARRGALEVLDPMGPEDRVALVTANAGGGLAGAGLDGWLCPDVEAAAEAVRRLEPGSGSFRLLPALDRAADLLQRLRRGVEEVYVFTDLQASAVPEWSSARWEFVAARLHSARLHSGDSPPSVKLVDCGSTEPRNRFVAAVEPPALAVGTDEAVVLRVVLEASGRFPREPPPSPIPVRLLVDEVEVGSVLADLQEDTPTTVEIAHRFPEAGPRRVTVATPPNGVEGDDRRHLVVPVLERIHVLVAGPTARRDPAPMGEPVRPLQDADYVDLALAPRCAGEPEPRVIFRVDRREEPAPGELSGYDVVVLSGLRRVTSGLAAALESFVRGGGGLLVFLAGRVDAVSWSEQLFRGGQGLLPARPVGGDGRAKDGVHPRDVAVTHPAISIFAGREEGDLSTVTIRRWTRLRDLCSDSVVLARVDAESPWILQKRFGAGLVVLVATSSTPADSDLPEGPLFLPLTSRLTRYLAGGVRPEVLLGEEISLPLEAKIGASGEAPEGESGLEVLDPRGARSSVPLTVLDGQLRGVFSETETPGFYILRCKETASPPTAPEARDPSHPSLGRTFAERTFALNVPPEESRLERLPSDVLARLRSALAIQTPRGVEEALRREVLREVQRQLWPSIVAAVLGLALLETFLGRGFARDRLSGGA